MKNTSRHIHKCSNGHVFQTELEIIRPHEKHEHLNWLRDGDREILFPHPTCPECGEKRVSGKTIKGTHNAKRECDTRCTMARGTKCQCNCSGEHHGSDLQRI